MSTPQILIFAILAATVALFVWGRFRHDVVALMALMASVVAGLVPAEEAFSGFGHPAVVTVACVLVLSQGLQRTGAVDWLARAVLPQKSGRLASMAALMALGAFLSSFMNNVGALALLMPVAVQFAARLDITPGQVLMPLAFCTILGGMVTLIGTPTNLIVSGFRAAAGHGPFAMFDFAPVGGAVALAGIALVVLVGWRLVPARKTATAEGFDPGTYLTEVRVPEGSKAVGLSLSALERESEDLQVVGLVRNEVRMTAPHGSRSIRAGDILVLEANVEALAKALSAFGIDLEEQKPSEAGGTTGKRITPGGSSGTDGEAQAATDDGDRSRADDVVLRELVVLPGSSIAGRSASDLRLRTRYGLNLLAVSRERQPPRTRLRTMVLKSGDLLLVEGPAESVADFIGDTRCVPLGERELRIPDRRMAVVASLIMIASVAIASLGLLPAAPAFTLGLIASMLVGTAPPRQVYAAIDWPVIVLLGALFPVATAMQTTGAAELLSRFLVETLAQGSAIAALVVILATTMLLSSVINNAATAAVLCPIAVGISASLGVDPDGFLMAVAIGASCAFLTPIGHQNNTLILGPGGFGFADYWKLGLPLTLLVAVVSVPLLLLVWPL